MQESKAYEEALQSLLTAFRARYGAEAADVAARVVAQGFNEFLFPFCSQCLGAKEAVIEKLKVVCPTCQGLGLKRFSDFERARSMQLSYGLTKRLAHKIRWVYDKAAALDALVNVQMGEQLERPR